MVLADSHRVPRVPWYLGVDSKKPCCFRLQGFYLLRPHFPECSTNSRVCNFSTAMRSSPNRSHDTGFATLARLTQSRFRLFPVRSPLLGESRLLSFPRGTEMVHFPPFASHSLFDSGMDVTTLLVTGCPIRRSPGQRLFAAHRGLSQLTTSFIAGLRQGIHRTPLLA